MPAHGHTLFALSCLAHDGMGPTESFEIWPGPLRAQEIHLPVHEPGLVMKRLGLCRGAGALVYFDAQNSCKRRLKREVETQLDRMKPGLLYSLYRKGHFPCSRFTDSCLDLS